MSIARFKSCPACEGTGHVLLTMETVGSLIRSTRRAAGLTQDQLALRIHSERSAVSMYETGEREPSLARLRAIAAVLGCSMRDLVPD